MDARKRYPSIGCCGIDCGLCPRFYTEGDSRCPGCGGDGFELKHPPCSCKTCCEARHGLEVCAQCEEFPCAKFADRAKVERDSFVTHKRIFPNHERIREIGLDGFLSEQRERVSALENMLAHFDDGRSKGYFCLAAALLPVERVHAALAEAEASSPVDADRKTKARALKAALARHADIEGVSLSLSK